MRITIVGTGYVGLVTGVCLAHVGHTVVCVDNNEEKVATMQSGKIPIYEPGLEELFKQTLANKRLSVTSNLKEGTKDAEVIFLALPTPPGADGSADLSAVLQVSDELGPIIKDYTVIVNKSTVPVGTGEQVTECLAANCKPELFDVVSNPEFLREGLAVQDCLHPDRIVVGIADSPNAERASQLMKQLYTPLIESEDQIVIMDRRSSEMTKYAANSFLALKVSFMNEIANLCERVGADVDKVRLGIGPDPRIGEKFLYAGIGFGGSCFPKDVQALLRTADASEYDFKILRSIIEVNSKQKRRLVEKLFDYYKLEAGETLAGKRFAIWGLAFKPDTDDIREAPALEIIDALLERGATICAYDPEAADNTRRLYEGKKGSSTISFAASAMEATQGADALLITTEWSEFKNPDLRELKTALKAPLVFDGRNLFRVASMHNAGFEYFSIGR